MANIYVRSTDGSNADSGATWALAKATIAGAGAIDAAGDTIYVSQSHAESTAGAVSLGCAGTNATPSKLICANDGAEPPTALASTATVTVSTNAALSIDGSLYCYGITFISAGSIAVNNSNAHCVARMENCSFQTTNVGSAGGFGTAAWSNNIHRTELINCTFKTAGAGNFFGLAGDVVIRGGSYLSGSTAVTNIFSAPGDRTAASLDCAGFDFSNQGSSSNLFASGAGCSGRYVIRDCKLPASWSGSLLASGIAGPGSRYEMHNCDSGDTNYRLWVEDYAGSIKSETTIIRTGGASDGTTGLSWKMATSANAEYPVVHLESPEIVVWSDTTGSKTVTVEIVHDSQGAGSGSKFQDDEIWLEVMYLGTSGYPLGTWIRDCKADIMATAANQTDSSETWTTTGLASPVKQALSVSFTTAEKGFIHARVVMTKASKTCYVCPKLTVA